jgi:hypothetical protein
MTNLKEEFTIEGLREFFKDTEYYVPEEQQDGGVEICHHRITYQLGYTVVRTYWDVLRLLLIEKYEDGKKEGASEVRKTIRELINMP